MPTTKRPNITLRDLFWLVLVLALGLAWWLDRVRLASALRQEHTRALERQRESTTYRLNQAHDALQQSHIQQMACAQALEKIGKQLSREQAALFQSEIQRRQLMQRLREAEQKLAASTSVEPSTTPTSTTED